MATSVSLVGVSDVLMPYLPVAAGNFPDRLVVTCKNASMYGKQLRDVHIAGFSVLSDEVIRFRSRDDKVSVGDLLVGVRKYSSVGKAHETIFGWMQSDNDILKDLDSLEVDKNLFDRKV